MKSLARELSTDVDWKVWTLLVVVADSGLMYNVKWRVRPFLVRFEPGHLTRAATQRDLEKPEGGEL